MRTITPSLTLVLFCLVLNPVVFADPLTNGGFETGLAPWTSIGTAGSTGSVTAGSLTLDPFDGAAQGFAQSGYGLSAVPLYTDGAGGDLFSFAGLTDPSILPPDYASFSGSAIRQTFTANAGDVLSMQYNVATNSGEGSQGDPAVLIILASDGLLDLFINDADFGVTDWNELGYLPYTYTFLEGGNFALTVLTVDENDSPVSTYLFVDNAEITAIPEPASFLLLGTGLGVVSLIVYRKKRK
jgi:hypothetical protein